MSDQSINQHGSKTTLDWLFNILIQPSSGTGSGVSPESDIHYNLSLDLIRQALVEIGNVVNNVTTTVPGKVLDARQGKTLADQISAILDQKAVANGIATLGSDGKIPSAQIPSLAIVDVFTVASQAEMLALDAEQGDMAIRTDSSQVFILSASPASTLENWVELAALEALINAKIDNLAGTGRTTETVKGNADAISTHISDEENPHGVTKSQVGLANCDNTSDANKPVSIAQQEALNAKESITNVNALKGVDWTTETVKGNADDISSHVSDEENPHGVTKSQVGLANVDNTSDADKPISTAQQTALNLKETVANVNTLKGAGWTDENLVDHEERITALEGVYDIGSWADVPKIVRAGLARKYLSIGDQLLANYNGSPVVWNVIGIDPPGLVPTDPRFTHTLVLQPQDCLFNAQFSAPQAMYNAVTALPAGTHIFITNGVQYQVTTTVEIPAGGVLYIATRDEYIPLTLTSYNTDRVTTIETGLIVTTATGSDTLTPINDHVRMRYGSNNPIDNALRQFLNSDEAVFNWEPQGLYDMPSSYSGTGGFLYQLDPELVAVIGEVENKVALASYDGGGQATVQDKAFLLSRVEVGLGSEGVTTGESVYEFYDGATNAERIKLLSGSPRYWWLRSPYVSFTSIVRYVGTSGALGGNYAYVATGLSPACVIY